MPYYRIVIWTNQRRKPYTGIRWIEADNITLVQGLTEKKAAAHFKGAYIDCEVQMLAKTSVAVRRYLEKNSK